MNLAEYIRAQRGNSTRLSARLGLAPSYLSQMVSGHRPIPFSLCPRIERATNGAVRCEVLRPDLVWVRIEEYGWPDGKPVLDVAAAAG